MATRRELLYRRNQGKQILGRYMEKINSLLSLDSDEIDFLSLEHTDRIKMGTLTKNRDGRVADLAIGCLETVIKEIRAMDGQYYLFIDQDWEYCGAFLIDSLDLIKEKFAFGTITDDILLIKKELDRKIEISYLEHNGEYTLEYSNFALS